MGGKQKQAQRTKNNARPSNSGRSAELLGTSLPQFASFAGMKEAGFSMTTFSLTPVDEFDSTVDSNFQLVFKKMNKKDATTKLKALQEYSDLIRTADDETIKGILPFWPRLYCLLSTDTDHRVREATHVAQKQVALKAKRNLAPYLKQLIGPWFTSQYDTYAPAATAATQAFQDAFPSDKLQGAIVFCQHEILNYICDNLTAQSAQTLKNSKNHSADECKAKYERILISSLHGYALYLNKLPEDSLKNAEEANRRIIGDGKFWKLSRHEISHVRAAWFGVLTALCQRASFLIVPEVANVVKAVFVNLDEQDPAVQTSVWEATLLTITTFDEWWKHININELLLPKLWKVLKEAGQGSATVIYPNLLPLLSHMPPTIDPDDFYPKFFNNMRIGLEQKSVKTSQSESRVISISLIECLQYVILKNQSNEELCTDLIKANLIPVLEYSIDNGQNAYKTLFNQIASLIQYWHRNRRHPDLNNYNNFVKLFWNLIINLLQSQIITYMSTYEGGDVNERVSRQIEFLICLKHTNKAKRILKVQFTESNDKSTDVTDSKNNTNPDESYLIALNNLVSTTCESYIKAVNQFKVSVLIDNIFSLLQEFESLDLLDYINTNVASGTTTTGLIEIYNNILLNWITDSNLFTRTIVDMIFLLFKYLKADEKSRVLKSLIGLQYQGINSDNWNDCLCSSVARALSHPHNLDVVVRDWLSNDNVGKYLVGIIKKIINDECSTDESLLLKKAFTETNDDGELFINKQCISEIISVITSCLLAPSDYLMTIDTCASLSAYIATILYSESGVQSLNNNLLITLFKFSCNNNVDPDCLSKDTIWEVNTAWQDAVTTLSAKIDKAEINKLTEKFAFILEEDFLSGKIHEISTKEFARQIYSYISAINKSMPLHVGCTMNIFFNRSFVPNWREYATHAIKSAEYVKGNLILSAEEIANIKTDIEQENLIKYFLWKEIVTNVLAMQLDNDDYCDDDYDEANDAKSLVVKVADNMEMLVYGLIEDMGQAEYLINNYKNIKHYKKIDELHQSIKEQLVTILEFLDGATKAKLENIINKNVNKDSNLLEVNTAYIYNVDMNKKEAAEIYETVLKNVEESRSLARLHLTQRFGKHLTYDNLCQKLNTFERIVTLRCLTHCDEIEVQIAEVYNRIENVRNEEYKHQFYNVNFSNWEQTQMIIEIIQLCTKLIEVRKIAQLSRRHWDFIVVSLGTWSTRLNEIKANHQNIQIALFITSISKLFSAAQDYVNKLGELQPNNSYVDEWNNVFVQSITTDLIKTWLYIAEKYGDKDLTIPFTKLPFLQEFGKVINSINPNFIFKTRIESMPKWSKLLKQSCLMLTSPVHCLQLWGYHMLITLSSGLTEVDSLSVDANKPHENGMIFEQFKGLLVETHDIVNAMLIDFRLGEDSCRVEPFTDSYTYTFAYLLIWDVLLNLCEKSSTELKYQYSDWLRKEDLLNCLLSSIFKLLPSEVLHYFDGRVKPLYEWFLQKCPLNLDDSISSEKIERMVCWVYSSALSQLPVSVRQWWKDVETRNSRIVERITSAYVSPHLCLEELKNVTEHESKFRNMVIKVHPAIREVVAVYTVDDSHMELVITLPLNYPLCGPKVECGRQISGTPHKQWLMQLEMCVTHQNGHIWDALSLWNSNLDRKFDGVEECYICFAVLHPGTFQLPKLGCRTCRKKFHAACLYKWFSTSNKSTCPTCRNLF